MVDTTWRPELQRFVVANVMNATGWPVQLFHGLSNGPRLAGLFHSEKVEGRLTLTSVGSDSMEDWLRLSSLMLLADFWRACVAQKILIFQASLSHKFHTHKSHTHKSHTHKSHAQVARAQVSHTSLSRESHASLTQVSRKSHESLTQVSHPTVPTYGTPYFCTKPTNIYTRSIYVF